MGIPKFFRWMSERYPLCCQLITENRIPEFDNLYLDMNGIIHNCSHPNDTDAHYRITEEQIWMACFSYIDHLFAKIKPRKLFFMAIDGVAPRAKMNQQRSRRFRTAREAEDNRRRALSRSEKLPDEDPFDSNCITPGTEFMKRLTAQLKYFINKKISEDANWRGVEIVLSGHEVPGEGEHKIMEYIRLAKAQPGYDPNMRHCLYGLDADLIMLGLLSHDPHFCLLREEVTFGKAKTGKSKKSVDSQNFYLMHLSLLREYLDHEFQILHNSTTFTYDLERVIDDFVLLALFVGNDFLPHLPNLHIAEGALSLMFDIYKRVIPNVGGYLHEGGVLDLSRLEVLFTELAANFEREVYENDVSEKGWLDGKRAEGWTEKELEERLDTLRIGNGKRKGAKGKGRIVMTTHQKAIYDQIKHFVLDRPRTSRSLHFPPEYPARDRHFIQTVAKDFGLRHAVEYSSTDESKHVYLEFEEEDEEDEDEDEDEENTSEEEEATEAWERVMKKWENAEIVADVITEEEREERERKRVEEGMRAWKKDYYWSKMKIDHNDPMQLEPLVEVYVTGLQWVLHYYYSGVASWGWFYPYHYAPKISDLVDLQRFHPITFDLGEPFKPFEQLMGVLPTLSKKLIPPAYRELMTDPTSPILDFYPTDFELDMNGKKQDWEAIVKIPFIDQARLLDAMRTKEHRLTEEERERTRFGESLKFTYDKAVEEEEEERIYKSPIPEVFPDVYHCKAKMELFHLPTLEGGKLRLNKGLCEGVRLGVRAMAGFPSLQTIPHTATLESCGVNVFQSDSKNESIVLTLQNLYDDQKPEDIAYELLGQRVFVGYPFLQEAMVRALSDELFRYELEPKRQQIVKRPHDPQNLDWWRKRADRIEITYGKKAALHIGHVECVVHACMLKGLKRLENGALKKEYANEEVESAVQTIVKNVEFEDSRFEEHPPLPIATEFPLQTRVFFLSTFSYGSPSQVVEHLDKTVAIKLIVSEDVTEPKFGRELADEALQSTRYMPSFSVAKRLQIAAFTLSKLTASLHVASRKDDQHINLGLNLKFEAKRQKVLGYSRKTKDGVWEYSEKAVALLQEYKTKFPEFFAGLEKKMRADFYHAEDFYPAEQANAKMQEIKAWLKTTGVHDLERTALDADQLPKDYVARIESAAGDFNDGIIYRTIILRNTPRQALLKPAHAPTRLQNQKFQLGDRVIFVQDSGGMPTGAKGTVVGIEEQTIDVVLDSTFMGGTTLGGRCSQYRGMTVNRYSLLNLSNPQYADVPPGQAPRPVLTNQFRPGQQHQQQHHNGAVQRPPHHQIGMNGPIVIAQRPQSQLQAQQQQPLANFDPNAAVVVSAQPLLQRGEDRSPQPFLPRPLQQQNYLPSNQQFRPRGGGFARGPSGSGRGFSRGGRGGGGGPHVPAVPM